MHPSSIALIAVGTFIAGLLLGAQAYSRAEHEAATKGQFTIGGIAYKLTPMHVYPGE